VAVLLAFRLPIRRRSISLVSIRAALLGCGKPKVTQVLGTPRVASHGQPDTWYYPLDSKRQFAMAVSFDHERVRSVEFINTPS
jgi:outer membrane protein assembly factor BamE (lipoprotein component of BamABCDE complex)